jgi:hypothetical protein
MAKHPFTEEQRWLAASAAHQANKEYCESIGDMSQPAWNDAPDWQKHSALDGVRFAIDNDFPLPEAMHENWMKVKLADGWVYGEVKDADAKTHPCLVPYAELPEAQRMKDDIFRDTIMDVLLPSDETGEKQLHDDVDAEDMDDVMLRFCSIMASTTGQGSFANSLTETEAMACAACLDDFIRANPDAPANAGVQQVRMKLNIHLEDRFEPRKLNLALRALKVVIAGLAEFERADAADAQARFDNETLAAARGKPDPDTLSYQADKGRGELSGLGQAMTRQS